jgi:hypothetical protein
VTKALRLQRSESLIYDALVTLLFASLVASLLHPALLSSNTLPTGGDTASHVLYAKVFQEEVLPAGRLTGWMPEVFAGFPLMSYYFPLPFVAAAGLGQFLGFAAGLKWAMVLPSILLPGTVFAVSRHMLRLPLLAAWAAALGSVAFLLHEQNAIWGGNLLSVLAGEFAYSWGMWLALMTLCAWWRAAQQPGKTGAWVLPAVLEALTGLSHGYPLLWVGFASWLLVLAGGPTKQIVMLLLRGHLAAFCLLGGWLWPLLEMHPYTIPNDASTPINGWADALPPALWPMFAAGAVGFVGLLLGRSRLGKLSTNSGLRFPPAADRRELSLLCFGALASAWAVCASIGAERVGLLDVRFLPLAWLIGTVVCGWALGLALRTAGTPPGRLFLGISLMCATLAWVGPRVREVPAWSFWNHSGLESKPQWKVLSRLLPHMTGQLDSPRLLFEHDPSNEDLGSTRVLEALPLFLGQRPVLEGLYMESALIGPAIYQLQSEVSARPSSPLVRFPSGQLDPDMAAVHMQMLHASQVLLRSQTAATALLESGHFELQASEGPFKLLRLKTFVDALVDPTPRPWSAEPRTGWMLDSYKWFRSGRLMQETWPVYADSIEGLASRVGPDFATEPAGLASDAGAGIERRYVSEVSLTRHSLSFRTDHLGQPHLIKMAYHPRWKLTTPGSLQLAAPGFMLVIPTQTKVELSYGTTWIGHCGMAATALALVVLLLSLARRWSAKANAANGMNLVAPDVAQTEDRPLTGWYIGGVSIGAACLVLTANSPGIAYHDAWDDFRQGQHRAASQRFYNAYEARRSPAGKEEALFWSAKSADAAGQSDVALRRYSKLTEEHYGHWVAESLSEVFRLAHQMGDKATAEKARQRLLKEFPRSTWTVKVNGKALDKP